MSDNTQFLIKANEAAASIFDTLGTLNNMGVGSAAGSNYVTDIAKKLEEIKRAMEMSLINSRSVGVEFFVHNTLLGMREVFARAARNSCTYNRRCSYNPRHSLLRLTDRGEAFIDATEQWDRELGPFFYNQMGEFLANTSSDEREFAQTLIDRMINKDES